MTESQLERQIRDWYGAQVPDTQTAPIRLHRRLSEIVAIAPVVAPASAMDRLPGVLSNRTLQFAFVSAAAVVLAVVVLAVLSARAPIVGVTPAPVLPSLSTQPTASPTHGHSPGTWTSGTPMNGARAFHTSTLLADGRVLVTGGLGPYGIFRETGLKSSEIYDPVSQTWKRVADMTTSHVDHAATLLSDGRVLVSGGSSRNPWLPGQDVNMSAEIYDPKADTWTTTGSMSIPRDGHSAVLLQDGRVLVAGGDGRADGPIPMAETWDPQDGSWSSTGSVATGLHRIPVVLADGRVLMVAGYDESKSGQQPYAQIYDPLADEWLDPQPMERALTEQTLTVLRDDRVLLAGGFDDRIQSNEQPLETAELYDSDTGMWSPTGSLTFGRDNHQALLLNDGAVLVVGGSTWPLAGLQVGELYAPTDGTWTATATMPTTRFGLSATVLLDGTVLIAGGRPPSSEQTYAMGSTDIFDPSR